MRMITARPKRLKFWIRCRKRQFVRMTWIPDDMAGTAIDRPYFKFTNPPVKNYVNNCPNSINNSDGAGATAGMGESTRDCRGSRPVIT